MAENLALLMLLLWGAATSSIPPFDSSFDPQRLRSRLSWHGWDSSMTMGCPALVLMISWLRLVGSCSIGAEQSAAQSALDLGLARSC